ncbi:MAG: alpha/beta hydrolase, partial [Acidobacteria bacterium]|nr:alpha/beta hydrolase [Acidobacteriota bacterium]
MKFAAALVCATVALAQQGTIESNVIYGMYSGAALLLDVHKPAKSNGRGVIFISGSGWQAPLGYGAPPLKGQQIPEWRGALLDAGFTVFAITHRAAPRFAYPAAIDDVQRAIRFVRHNAARYGIDPNRIGGVGGSSGGHLIALAAMLQAPGDASSGDAVDREPATLQCAVLRAAPTDMAKMFGANTVATAAVVSFVGAVPMTPEAQKMFRVAS